MIGILIEIYYVRPTGVNVKNLVDFATQNATIVVYVVINKVK
jgi:hypothetical protein